MARSILVQEATALKPIAFTDMQMDAEHIVIKRKCTSWNDGGSGGAGSSESIL